LHDCNPLKEEHTIVPRPTITGHWNGSCYKFAASLFHKGKFTVDIDNGLTVCKYSHIYESESFIENVDWEYFDQNRKELLNLISWDEFIEL